MHYAYANLGGQEVRVARFSGVGSSKASARSDVAHSGRYQINALQTIQGLVVLGVGGFEFKVRVISSIAITRT
jgi:hypothetical protein